MTDRHIDRELQYQRTPERETACRRHLHPLSAVALGAVALLSACEVGPDYERPSAVTPAAFKEAEGWKPGVPQDFVDRGTWWSVYNDPVLDGLLRQVEVSNENLKSFEAAFREARAVVDQSRAGLFPTVSAAGSGTRAQTAGHSPNGKSTQVVQNQFLLTSTASWDLDLWGRIRRTIESDVASAQASAADLASARLSAQATLASDYYNLRTDDELKHLLDETVVAFTKSLQITRDRFASGTAARTDVVQAQAQLKSTQSQAINVGVQRAQLEHAIAVLIGKAPSDFSIAPVRLTTEMPVIPPDIPSTLLERRPDIAAAERQVAAANALIGVAIAAYYPDLTLSTSAGFSSNVFSNLIQASNSIWSFGGQLSETVFDAGLRSAQVDQARAVYDQDVATYRQTVLSAFQQVEDELAAIRILAQQAEVQAIAVRDLQIAVELTLEQYKAGTVDYTSVITTQTNALTNEETALGILQNRLIASVTLIQALGGGWDTTQLPDPDRLDASASPPQAAATTE